MVNVNSHAALAEQPTISAQEYQKSVQSINYRDHAVDAQQFTQHAQGKNVTILDLRSPEEYAQSHINGANYLGSDIDEKKLQQLVPSKDSTVLIYCKNSLSNSPTRQLSLTVTSLPQFIALGYSKTYYLDDLNNQPQENELLIQKMLTNAD